MLRESRVVGVSRDTPATECNFYKDGCAGEYRTMLVTKDSFEVTRKSCAEELLDTLRDAESRRNTSTYAKKARI